MNFLITSTEARVGKTMLGCALAFAFKVRGMRVGVMKPIAIGCAEMNGDLESADGTALIASASSDLPKALVSPYRYRAEAPTADATEAPRFERIVGAYREIAARSHVTIVEDSGGLTAPLESGRDFADLALAVNLEVILVVANREGFEKSAADVAEFARRRGVAVRGFILNALTREASAKVDGDAQLVAGITGLRCLGTVRFKEPVSLAIVERLLSSAPVG